MRYGRVILAAVGLAVFVMSCISIGVGLALWNDAKYGNDVYPGIH